MSLSPLTPVIVGVGQSTDRIDAADYHAWSASDLAAVAARAAAADAGVGAELLRRIDAIGAIRTFEDSIPGSDRFGKSDNFPRSIAKRLGIEPAYAAWAKIGGNTPQDLVNEFAERIAAGEFAAVLITGAEAISTVRHALSQGRTLDFSERPGGTVDDRGLGAQDFKEQVLIDYQISTPILAYALAENARRARLGLDRKDYALSMGQLFAPFAAYAHNNPYSAWSVPAYTPQELIGIGPHNRWIADPYPLHLVARDQVNLGAAVLMTSWQLAQELGIPASKQVYLHGYAQALEKQLLRRPDLGASPAARAAVRQALQAAAVGLERLVAFDFYSCFPIAVSHVAQDELGLAVDDPRGLTVTGGLPFFGGPGNNYSLHAIAEIVAKLRQSDGYPGLVGANGGYLSKYSVGVYSAEPKRWQVCDSRPLQAKLDAVADVELHWNVSAGRVETYTVQHQKGQPVRAIVVGRSAAGERFIASTAADDAATAQQAHQQDALGRRVKVRTVGERQVFEFSDG